MKTESDTQRWARKTALYIAPYLVVCLGIISLWMPFIDAEIPFRWFKWPHMLWVAPVPISVIICVWALFRSIHRGDEYRPFFLVCSIFLLGYIGLAISLWPWIVPYRVNVWDAAASGPSQSFMLVGVALILPVILGYTAYCYYVFKGKTTNSITY